VEAGNYLYYMEAGNYLYCMEAGNYLHYSGSSKILASIKRSRTLLINFGLNVETVFNHDVGLVICI
jgi:hypothetical protein